MILLVVSIILILSIFAGKAGYRFGLPALLLFLGVGMLFGSDGLGIQFDNPQLTQFIGTLALSIILFSGGMDTKLSEVRPIASRLSKGLYRYAVMLDMLCQIIAYQDTQWSPDDLELLRRFANVRVAKMRGKIDLEALLNDNGFRNEREENTEDYL